MSLEKVTRSNIKLLSAVIFMMAALQVFSGTQSLSSSLIYDDKPIDAMCFTESKHDSLKNCGIHYKLQAYDDLEACAACCAGTVMISRPLKRLHSMIGYKSPELFEVKMVA